MPSREPFPGLPPGLPAPGFRQIRPKFPGQFFPPAKPLVPIFGISAKFAAQRWGRELRGISLDRVRDFFDILDFVIFHSLGAKALRTIPVFLTFEFHARGAHIYYEKFKIFLTF